MKRYGGRDREREREIERERERERDQKNSIEEENSFAMLTPKEIELFRVNASPKQKTLIFSSMISP